MSVKDGNGIVGRSGVDIRVPAVQDHATENGLGPDPAEECLAKLLRTFFPEHVGSGNRHQARGYIRISAIGRGSYPQGSPGPRKLISALESLGFSRRTRSGHLQAPWGRCGGGRPLDLRNELSAFLTLGAKGPRVQSLLGRIRRDAGWPFEGSGA